MKLRIPMFLALLLLACDPGPEPESDRTAERSPAPEREPACELGSLGCRCPDDGACWAGYRCAYASGSATVCGLETFGAEACDDHGLGLAGAPVVVTGACVASCSTDSDCGSLICAPVDGGSICAWP